jgi:hypothetical protein
VLKYTTAAVGRRVDTFALVAQLRGNFKMSTIIHARLDSDTDSLRNELQKQFGWSDSQIVREGIKSLSALMRSSGKRKIVGLGKFESGVSDLGSNKKHLREFGR